MTPVYSGNRSFIIIGCAVSSLGLPFDPFLRCLLTTVVLNFNVVELRNLFLYSLWVLYVI